MELANSRRLSLSLLSQNHQTLKMRRPEAAHSGWVGRWSVAAWQRSGEGWGLDRQRRGTLTRIIFISNQEPEGGRRVSRLLHPSSFPLPSLDPLPRGACAVADISLPLSASPVSSHKRERVSSHTSRGGGRVLTSSRGPLSASPAQSRRFATPPLWAGGGRGRLAMAVALPCVGLGLRSGTRPPELTHWPVKAGDGDARRSPADRAAGAAAVCTGLWCKGDASAGAEGPPDAARVQGGCVLCACAFGCLSVVL